MLLKLSADALGSLALTQLATTGKCCRFASSVRGKSQRSSHGMRAITVNEKISTHLGWQSQMNH